MSVVEGVDNVLTAALSPLIPFLAGSERFVSWRGAALPQVRSGKLLYIATSGRRHQIGRDEISDCIKVIFRSGHH